MTDDQMRELFREMRNEPVPADSLARVRLRVAERTAGGRPRLAWLWGLAAAVALSVVVLCAILWNREPTTPPVVTKQTRPVVTPKFVESEKVAARVDPAPRRVRPARTPRVAQPKPAHGAVAIRIETPDPDIVILLVSDDGPGV